MRNESKGFTLIEILAAVTILGILSVTAVVSVNKIIQNAKAEHYNAAENELKISGQNYVQQNRSMLPKTVGQKTKIPLKTLVENNYIQQVKDYNDNNCDLNKSYVQVFKYSQSDYSYIAYLKCPTYTSKEKLEKGSPVIGLTTTEPKGAKEATLSVKITDSEKLLSWSYIIYKDGKEVKNSGSIYLKNYPKSLNETISLAKYTPSKIKIVVTATNIYGLTTTKSTGTIDYKDTQGPTCIIKEVDKKTNPKSWTKGPVTVTVGCDDGDGVGCTKAEFTKTFKTTTDVGKITIEDKEGNKTTCEVSVNIDLTPPTCSNIAKLNNSSGTNYSSNSWTNQNIYTSATCTDQNSGCSAIKKVTTTGATGNQNKVSNGTYTVSANGTSTTTWYVYDVAGNEVTCQTITEKKDATPPTITSSTIEALADNITGVITDNNALAGYAITTSKAKPSKWTTISGTSVTKTETKESGTYYIHAIDAAGNWSYKEQTVKTPKKVTATFNGNGATVGSKTLDCYIPSGGATCTVTAPSITRSGYTAVGFSTSSTSKTAAVPVGGSITLSGNTTYYAITKKTLSATFDYKISDEQNFAKWRKGDTSISSEYRLIDLDAGKTYKTKSCTIYNAETACSINAPVVEFVKKKKENKNEYFTYKQFFNFSWKLKKGSTVVNEGASISISGSTDYILQATVNKKDLKVITSQLEGGTSNIWIRNSNATNSDLVNTQKYGYALENENAVLYWEGSWKIGTTNSNPGLWFKVYTNRGVRCSNKDKITASNCGGAESCRFSSGNNCRVPSKGYGWSAATLLQYK